ncbi:MAG: class I SAM-dependent methyltransferase [Candidatus Firestonebacteria bacterium]
MRDCIFEFAKICAETLPISGPIYEFGAFIVPGQEYDLHALFKGKEYIGCDMREGKGVDRVLNLHKIDLPDNAAGAVLIFETLEHVEYPHKAIEEAYRILKPGGIIVITSVLDFEIHDYPNDYWRFTPEAFESLLKNFKMSFVGNAGISAFPHTIVGFAAKDAVIFTGEFESKYRLWKEKWDYPGSIFKKFVKAVTPPIIKKLYYKIKNGNQNKNNEPKWRKG